MNSSGSFQVTSKYVGIFSKLLRGLSPRQVAPQETEDQFFGNLLDLDIKREFLQEELGKLSKDACLGPLKPLFNQLVKQCIYYANTASYQDVKKVHALETLGILSRCLFAKNLSGWEAMDIFAGGANESDTIFMTFTELIYTLVADEAAPFAVRQQALRLGLVFMCANGQLSPGAYLLRRDLFPSLAAFIKSPAREGSSAEAILLVAILANFHKSDAARLNPYLKCIKNTTDRSLVREICRGSYDALQRSIGAYQDISNDTLKRPNLASTIGSFVTSFKTPRAITALANVDPPRELFRTMPPESSVLLLPVFEFLRSNTLFREASLMSTSDQSTKDKALPPLPFSVITLSSYLLTHASSTSSPRSLAYANLALHIIFTLIDDDETLESFCEPTTKSIHICRQRLPILPVPPAKRPPICAILDCCVLWLRHNLHKQIQVYSYLYCIQICYRILWFLQARRIRLEYEWNELWIALLGLCNFLATKLDSLTTTGGIEQILRETISLLFLAVTRCEVYLPTPTAVHEFIYELVRSHSVLKQQVDILKSLTLPQYSTSSRTDDGAMKTLTAILDIVGFYESKVGQAGGKTAKDSLHIVAQELEANGLHTADNISFAIENPRRSEDVLGFARFGCMDGLSLLT